MYSPKFWIDQNLFYYEWLNSLQNAVGRKAKSTPYEGFMLRTTEQNVHSLTIQSLEGILMFTITLKLNVRLGAKDGFGKAPVSSR